MTHDFNPERAEAVRIETERSEIRAQVEQCLRESFAGVLEEDELERRLEEVRNMKIVGENEFARLWSMNNHTDDGGCEGFIVIDVGVADRVTQYPIVMDVGLKAETLHIATHEGVHLMAPRPNVVADPMEEDSSEWKISSALGALYFERDRKTLKPDWQSIMFTKPKERTLFWEAMTDWLADDILKDVLADDEKQKLETTGYVEKLYIHHLISRLPNKDAFRLAVRQAYADGNEDVFRGYLQKLTGRTDDAMYEELLDVLKIDFMTQWKERMDAWMRVVAKYLA
jgi:hypothetical protein